MAVNRTKRYPNTVQRRKLWGPGMLSVGLMRPPLYVVSMSAVSLDLTITFSDPFTVGSIPTDWIPNGGRTIVNAALVFGDTLVLTLSSTGVSSIRIPNESPSIRSYAGGFVVPGLYPIPYPPE